MSSRDKVIALVIGAYAIDLIFDLMHGSGPKMSFFPFFHGYGGWDGKMTLHNYVYGYCQHVYVILMMYAVYIHTGRKYWECLMWLEVVDVIDYGLHYNHTLFVVLGYSIELNYFKFVAVLYLTHLEYGTRA